MAIQSPSPARSLRRAPNQPSSSTKGEVLGFSLVYSGNFLAQAEVDTWDTTRITLGINPFGFDWKLEPGEGFQTPEAVAVYSHQGMGAMSRARAGWPAKRV